MKITSYLTAAILCFLRSFSSNLIADGNIEVTVRRGDLRIQGGRALGQALWENKSAIPGRYLLATNGSTTLNGRYLHRRWDHWGRRYSLASR